nr:hypothetical protein [Candidatus Njordarchaeota archaeon]
MSERNEIREIIGGQSQGNAGVKRRYLSGVLLAAFIARRRGNRVGERRIYRWMKPAAPADEYSSIQVCCGKPATTATATTAAIVIAIAKRNFCHTNTLFPFFCCCPVCVSATHTYSLSHPTSP